MTACPRRRPGRRAFRPGGVPAGSAFSRARARPGGQAARKACGPWAARGDAEAGLTALRKGLRIAAHARAAGRQRTGAGIGSCHHGDNDPAGRGFFPMNRFARFPAAGADPARQVKDSAKSLPRKTPQILPGGSELAVLHEPDGMRARQRRESRNHAAPRLPGTIAGLITFTILAQARGGRPETTRIRALTTLPGRQAHPARQITALHAGRRQIETAFPHVKTTARGPRRPLRGQPRQLARQEARALPLIRNAAATAAARAAARAGTGPRLIPSTAVPALARAHAAAGACCPHCGHRPPSANDQLSSLNNATITVPRHQPGRQRPPGRTAAERRDGHTEEVTYTISIEKPNLPQWDTTPET
jgi:hypothetical protein